MHCILISDNCSDLSGGKGLSKEESQIENNIINLFKKHKWYSKTWKNIDVIYSDVPKEDLDIILRNTSQFSSLPYSTLYRNYDLSFSILVSDDKAMLPFEDTIRYLSYRFEELKRDSIDGVGLYITIEQIKNISTENKCLCYDIILD